MTTNLLREGERWVRGHEDRVLIFRQDYRGRIIFVAVRAVQRESRGKMELLGIAWDTKDCKGVLRNNRPYERAWAMLESMLWYGLVEITTEPIDEYMGRYERHF